MTTIRILVVGTFLLVSSTFVHAHSSDETPKGSSITVDAKSGDGPERISSRQQPASGTRQLLSTNRWSEMMLKDDTVYLQLTDYGLKQVGGTRDAQDKDEGLLGNMLKTMALSGVRQLLDHSIGLSLVDTRSALARDGDVILVTCQGKEVFNKVKINDQVQKYPQEKAEEFVRNLNRARAKLPACRA
jgi:hypothetical protein